MKALAACLLALATPVAPLASAPAHAAPAPAPAADRADILAMAGDYKVTFDMRETTAWRADYTPIAPKISGGFESVRLVEEGPRRIVLQHLLVVSHDGASHVIKHWRQDWVYEPAELLVYAGRGRWELKPVTRAERAGRWSQTVWQTDDSPRYGGLGRWESVGGVRRWTSDATWRPLARRDAIRNPPYDRYIGINRHSPTPGGWIHWQDNIKMTPGSDGAMEPIVQESLLNTYARAKPGTYDVAAADAYWAATKAYWAAVRGLWDAAIRKGRGVSVSEAADTGSVSGVMLMKLADDLQSRKIDLASATDPARKTITYVTNR